MVRAIAHPLLYFAKQPLIHLNNSFSKTAFKKQRLKSSYFTDSLAPRIAKADVNSHALIITN